MVKFFDLKESVLRQRQELIDAMISVLDSGWYILGEKLKNFEYEFSEYLNVKHSSGVANGMDALTIALKAKGIGPGDEVIVPAHTFVATWLAVTAVGANIVPVDVDIDTCLLDIEKVKNVLTSKTKAVIPVHLFGRPFDVSKLREIVGSSIFILEDAAQAHGASISGVKAGALGDAAAFSFYPAKTLGALGDGGAVTTNDAALKANIDEIRNYGSKEKYVHNVVGINSRLDEIQAAILSVKLRMLDRDLRDRNRVAKIYDKYLSGVKNIIMIPNVDSDVRHAYHLYVIRVKNRSEVMAKMGGKEIFTQIHYPITPFSQKAYRDLGYEAKDFPNSNLWAETSLSLPFSPQMSESDVVKVVEVLRSSLE